MLWLSWQTSTPQLPPPLTPCTELHGPCQASDQGDHAMSHRRPTVARRQVLQLSALPVPSRLGLSFYKMSHHHRSHLRTEQCPGSYLCASLSPALRLAAQALSGFRSGQVRLQVRAAALEATAPNNGKAKMPVTLCPPSSWLVCHAVCHHPSWRLAKRCPGG